MALAVPLADRAEQLAARGYSELGGPNGPVPEAAVRATLDALARGETHYTDRPGILPLREAVTRKLRERFGLDVDPKANTVITCGATEARFVAVQELLRPGDGLYAGASLEQLEGPLIIRGARFTENLGEARVLYLTSSVPESEQRGLLEGLSGGALVIFELDDETGSFHLAQLEAFADRTVTVGDLGVPDGLLSWRVGFLAAPPVNAAGLRDFKQALTICTTNLSQWAALSVMAT